MAFLHFANRVHKALEKGEYTIDVSDLVKAFDTVRHSILLNKPEYHMKFGEFRCCGLRII